MNMSDEPLPADLAQQLSDARATIAGLLAGQIDAVIDPKDGAPVLLRHALQALQQSEARYRYIVERRTTACGWSMPAIRPSS